MKLARFFPVLFHSPSSVTYWLLAAALFLAPGAGWAAGSPAHPGDSSAAPFGARQVPGDPEGTAILNVDSGMSYPTIQDAVDAASPGDVLEVTVPDHVEGQVLVDKDLTLRSQQTAEGGPPVVNTVRMGVDTGNAGDDRGWFLVDTGVDLQVLNLAFDGDGHLVYQGFRHKGTGRFENVHFDDIQYNASGPDFAGLAIVAFGGNVDVVGCSFANVGRVGVLAFGAGLTDSSIVDSVYVGKGDGTFLDYAADVSAGAVVTLAGNKVSDCRGVATDGSSSAGFLVTTLFGPGTTAELIANDVTASTTGVAVGFGADSSTVSAAFNRLVGNTVSGLDSTSSNPVAAENNWWGCNAGPTAAACDPVTGTGSVDFDPWLVLGLEIDPTLIPATGNSLLTADLAANSDGADVSGLGSVIDGCILASFDPGSKGTVDPAVVTFEGGTAETLFTAGTDLGAGTVSVTVDAQTVDGMIVVSPAADLGLTKRTLTPRPRIGEPLVYELTVINNGPLDATGVTVVDDLPATAVFGSAAPSQGSCVHDGSPAGGAVTCDLGTLGVAATATVLITVTPTEPGPLFNSAGVDAVEIDPEPVNDVGEVSDTVELPVLEIPTLGGFGAALLAALLAGLGAAFLGRRR